MERRQGKKLFWQLSDFECEKPNMTGQEGFGEGCGISTPCPGLSGWISANGGTAQELHMLSFGYRAPWVSCCSLLLPTPPVPSVICCWTAQQISQRGSGRSTDQVEGIIQMIPSTSTPWEGQGRAGKKAVIFKGEFTGLVASPQRAVLNQKMVKYKICGTMNWDRSWEVWNKCPRLHPAANTVIQTENRNKDLGYNKQAVAETVLQVWVTSVDADPFYLLFHQIPNQTFSMKLESYRRPNEVLLLYSISPEKSLCNLRPRSGISGYSVFPNAQGLSTSLVCNILRPLSRKHLKEGRSLPQLLHEQDFTPNHVLDVEKREDTVDAFCSTQNHFHVRTFLCTHGDTTLLAGKYHLCSLQELRCEAMVNWVEMNSKHTSFTQISFL